MKSLIFHKWRKMGKSAYFGSSNRRASFIKKMDWVFLLSVILLLVAEVAFGQETPLSKVEYRDLPLIGSRNFIWIIAQVHVLFGAFVLGVPIFAWVCEIIGYRTGDFRYDRLAKEFTKLIVAGFEMAATLGLIFLFSLVILYPKLMNYMARTFMPTFYFYIFLFLAETVAIYLYWSKWDPWQSRKKTHLFVGFVLNVVGFFVMIVPSSFLSFQASPVVVGGEMAAWERAWAAMNNPTWWPVNIHRLVGNVILGGFVCGAYAAVRYLGAKTQEEREHYDWMGYTGNFIGTFGLLPMPFAGYWLMREVYAYNQQMGITLMGGILSWLFILQAVLIGVLFIGANYYFWQGLAYRTSGGVRYKKPIFIMLVVLVLCFGVWLTPHSLVATLQEARAMGGSHHPLLGVLGVMSAKLTVINLMILTTFASFIMYWRANKQETVSWGKASRIVQYLLFTVVVVGIIWAGVYGYFVPAIFRINILAVGQVLAVLFVMFTMTPLTALALKSAKATGQMKWGNMPPRSQYTLIINAVTVVLTMSLMGFARSAKRVHWHIYGVMEDTSPYAFTPTLGHASAFFALNTFLFCCIVGFIWWVSSTTLRSKAFATQYFILPSFFLWLLSLPEKMGARAPQVSSRPRFFAKVVGAIVIFLLIWTYVGYQVPQKIGLPPTKEALDYSAISTGGDLSKIGQKIFFGKGQCALCHSLGVGTAGRCPNIGGENPVGRKLTREFLYETYTNPEAYVYMDFTADKPTRFGARMPQINKPPIGLSEPEMLMVHAFLQSRTGKVEIDPAEVVALLKADEAKAAAAVEASDEAGDAGEAEASEPPGTAGIPSFGDAEIGAVPGGSDKPEHFSGLTGKVRE